MIDLLLLAARPWGEVIATGVICGVVFAIVTTILARRKGND